MCGWQRIFLYFQDQFNAIALCKFIMRKNMHKNIMHKSIMQMYYCKSIIIPSLFGTCCMFFILNLQVYVQKLCKINTTHALIFLDLLFSIPPKTQSNTQWEIYGISFQYLTFTRLLARKHFSIYIMRRFDRMIYYFESSI